MTSNILDSFSSLTELNDLTLPQLPCTPSPRTQFFTLFATVLNLKPPKKFNENLKTTIIPERAPHTCPKYKKP